MTHTNQRTPTPMPSQKLASALNEFLHQSRDKAQTPHATQPAEVTDDLVEKARAETFQKTGADLIPEVAATFARAILALRPVQVPMDKQDAWDNSPVNSDWEAVDAYLQGIEDAEAHHGITAQAKKGGA